MPNRFARLGLIVALLGLPGAAVEAATAPAEPKTPAAMAPNAAPPPVTDAQRFCQNVATAAADARFTLQTRRLNELQSGIATRLAALEAKEAEVKAILAERDEAKKRAEGGLLAIYAKMRPEAAAEQIAAMDDGIAAAVLAGLNARQSSAILNQIPTERAVKLVNTMAGIIPPLEKPAPPAPAQDTKS